MTYLSDQKPSGLTALTALASDDTIIVGDTSDTSEVVKTITRTNFVTDLSGDFQTILTEGAFVDGDKTKLDSIETSATADQTGAEIKAAYEAEANAFTDAQFTKLAGIEASADVTDTDNVRSAGALMDDEVTNLAQVKAFDSSDYAAALSADDNYVTDAEKVVIGNTSGTNTGDQDISGITTNASAISTLDTNKADKSNVLELDNTTAFTPDADYEPATKKYVDDNAGGGGVGTSGTPVANDFARFTDATTIEGRSKAEVLADLDLEIGTDVQAYDAQLNSIAGLVPGVEGRLIESNGLGGYQMISASDAVTNAGALMESEVTNLAQVKAFDTTDYAAALGADDNYVTDAEKVVIGNTSGTNTGDEAAASTTTAGISELATTAEVDTGTDTGRTITPDSLAGSYAGTKEIMVEIFPVGTDTATGDGKWRSAPLPASCANMNLVDVKASVHTAGTTGTTDIQIHNVTDAVDMLSTKLTIDSGETTSETAATAAVINTSNDDVAEGDVLRVDVDAVSTTAAQGLDILLTFRLP